MGCGLAMDWQICDGLLDWSRIDIRLADWQWIGRGLANWKWIGGLVMDW